MLESPPLLPPSGSRRPLLLLTLLLPLSRPANHLLQVTKYVEREIINHRQLVHPHIIQFKEVRGGARARWRSRQLVPSPA